ncbi:MAG: hypothetical protein P4L87_19835 [Formivibrio sp.]|nr:hypothetical protein [Formivibrio sp.]
MAWKILHSNSATRQGRLANSTTVDRTGLVADARIYGLDGEEVWHNITNLNVPATNARDCFSLARPEIPDQVHFVKLKLSSNNSVLSKNFYWSEAQGGDCTGLNALTQLSLPVSTDVATEGDTHKITVKLSNPNPAVALAIRLKAVRKASHARVLPAMYEDNYFSLLPGERKTVAVRFLTSALGGEVPVLVVEGWNVQQESHCL